MARLTSAEILAVVNAGGSVMLPNGTVVTTAAGVPTQAALDAGTFDAYSDQANQASLLAARIARPNSRRFSWVLPTGSGVPNNMGDNPVLTGTASVPTVSAAIPAVCYNLATAATLNDVAYAQGVANHLWLQRPLWQSFFVPGFTGTNIAVARFWLGLAANAWTAVLAADAPAVAMAAFRYSPGAGDANYKCVTCDGSTRTIIDSGVAPAAGVGRKFEVSDDGGTTTFKIDGNVVAATALTRPPNTALCRSGCGVQTLEAVIKSIAFGWLYAETNAP